MIMTATMTWAYPDCGENKEVGHYSGPTQKPYVPLGNHTNSLPEKTPSYSVGPGESPWYFSVATAAYQKGQAQRTRAKAGEIWRNRDRVPEPGRNQFWAALRMGSSQQSTIMRFRTYKESRPFRHAHFINTVKLSTTFLTRSLDREHLPETAASETLQHSFEYWWSFLAFNHSEE